MGRAKMLKVAWLSVGLASGTAASKSREAAMGLMGLLAAPAGFHVSGGLFTRAVCRGIGRPRHIRYWLRALSGG